MTRQSFWQKTRADGSPAWPVGAQTFEHMWEGAEDLLRFHKGTGFRIKDVETGQEGPARRLRDVPHPLKNQMQTHPDRVFKVTSEKDGFALAFRRHTEELKLLGEKFLDIGRGFIGAPYKLGGVTPWGMDCSGLVIEESEPFGISYAEHRARVMWAEFRANKDGKFTIPRSKILKGDLLVIHDGAHIATYIDDQYGGRVLDAQPSSVQSPWGWTPGGVHVRSMATNYYCSWENVNDVCRLSAINGAP